MAWAPVWTAAASIADMPRLLLALALNLAIGWTVPLYAAQAAPGAQMATSLHRIPADLWREQRRIWSSPLHWRRHWRLLAAATAMTALLLASDRHVSGALPMQGALLHDSRIASDIGLASLFAEAGGIFLDGWRTGSLATRRRGLAALESAGNAALAVEVLKRAARRQRPLTGNGHGDFWAGGTSFPSGHASLSWALAETLAEEYPHFAWMRWGNRSAAAVIGVLRVTGQRHFPSDVWVGGLAGGEIGHDVASQLRPNRQGQLQQHAAIDRENLPCDEAASGQQKYHQFRHIIRPSHAAHGGAAHPLGRASCERGVEHGRILSLQQTVQHRVDTNRWSHLAGQISGQIGQRSLGGRHLDRRALASLHSR